jgi:hypothetical protein
MVRTRRGLRRTLVLFRVGVGRNAHGTGPWSPLPATLTENLATVLVEHLAPANCYVGWCRRSRGQDSLGLRADGYPPPKWIGLGVRHRSARDADCHNTIERNRRLHEEAKKREPRITGVPLLLWILWLRREQEHVDRNRSGLACYGPFGLGQPARFGGNIKAAATQMTRSFQRIRVSE